MRKSIKIQMIIAFLGVLLLLPAMAESSAGVGSEKEIQQTAKITFFKNRSGDLIAEIIPVNAEGYSPRIGWTICEMMPSDIRDAYSEKIKKTRRLKGYFRVTYRIIGKDPESIFLRYKGELVKIEPWVPPFTKNWKTDF